MTKTMMTLMPLCAALCLSTAVQADALTDASNGLESNTAPLYSQQMVQMFSSLNNTLSTMNTTLSSMNENSSGAAIPAIAEALIQYYEQEWKKEAPGAQAYGNDSAALRAWHAQGDPSLQSSLAFMDQQMNKSLQPATNNTNVLLNFLTAHKMNTCPLSAPPTANAYEDLNISRLLGKTQLDAAEYKNAEKIIHNLMNATPTGLPLSVSSSSSCQAGGFSADDQKQIAAALVKQAMLSVSTHSLLQSLMMRQALPLPLPSQGGAGPIEQTPTSILSIMENESKWRFLSASSTDNNSWYVNIQTASKDALLRELALMESFRLYMDYYRYLQNERIESLMATFLASQSRLSEAMGDMAEAMQKANNVDTAGMPNTAPGLSSANSTLPATATLP